mgnify:CR=1 FL=1
MDNTIEVTGIPTQLLKLLDERVRQTGSDRAGYIRHLIEKDIYGALERQNYSQLFQGKKPAFDPEQWEADMKALAQRAEEIPVLPEEAFTRESIYGDRD